MTNQNPVFCAIDTPDVGVATRLARELSGRIGGPKLGLEFFMANGPEGVRAVMAAGDLPIFLDMKLHDIPNTVAGAVRSLGGLGISILNVHIAGGPAMLDAAVKANMEAGAKRPKLIGVTVLTSFDDGDLNAVGVPGAVGDQVERMALMGQRHGLDGIVCSPHEVARVRSVCGPDFLIVVPGIRPSWSATNDQKRFLGPADALAAGADILVIGRPITAAENVGDAAAAIGAEISAA